MGLDAIILRGKALTDWTVVIQQGRYERTGQRVFDREYRTD